IKKTIKQLMNKILLTLFGAMIAVSMLAAPILHMSYAHQRALFEINGKDYLFVVGSANEPLYVDDKTAATLDAYWPNATDPTNTRANGTQPVTGLEGMLRVNILAGDKNMTSNLEPAYGEVGKYESETFYPTVATTFDYRIYGDINGTAFDVTFSCSPAGEQGVSDNSTVQISEGVERKSLLGGFGCPEERIGFPEPYISQYEISQELNRTSN
ncbi:MAG: hypothetical protein L0H55_15355, partial [Candidatus Nitrosocosmicus sp.]|nr:hypothetical protein [Candidatus Nitrosocosmicus sp.]